LQADPSWISLAGPQDAIARGFGSPYALFQQWQREVSARSGRAASIAVLATACSETLGPSQRPVQIFNGVGSAAGFFMLTVGGSSRKMQQLRSNARASLLYSWHQFGRYVSIEGLASAISDPVRTSALFSEGFPPSIRAAFIAAGDRQSRALTAGQADQIADAARLALLPSNGSDINRRPTRWLVLAASWLSMTVLHLPSAQSTTAVRQAAAADTGGSGDGPSEWTLPDSATVSSACATGAPELAVNGVPESAVEPQQRHQPEDSAASPHPNHREMLSYAELELNYNDERDAWSDAMRRVERLTQRDSFALTTDAARLPGNERRNRYADDGPRRWPARLAAATTQCPAGWICDGLGREYLITQGPLPHTSSHFCSWPGRTGSR
uniref:Putative_PNPOx domain-containing protein n=1 Tax=Macrostomum lignano TaxID=282301 RepID=A0A1I8FG10_9PLAT